MSRTKKKSYTKSKAVDKTCRNHGSCPYCKGNRTHQAKRALPAPDKESDGDA